MSVPITRLRFLNGGKDQPGPLRFRNEGTEPVWVCPASGEPKELVNPGQEIDLPLTVTGEVIIEQ